VKKLLWIALILSMCISCLTTSGPSVNGIYSGGLYDSSVGLLGGFAIDVTMSSSRVSGSACFVAITGETACNTLSGTMDGERFTFRVGSISFSSTVSGNRIQGTYSSSTGSGTINLTKDINANLKSSGQGNLEQRLEAEALIEAFRLD
jgi:hypothetical protein